MPLLTPTEVTCAPVKLHSGVHLYHDPHSLCCRQVRICLSLKKIPHASHVISLSNFENLTEQFFSINPRGQVPVLVHDGKVIIETADIIAYVDAHFSGEPRLIPAQQHSKAMALMEQADSLRMHLRTISTALKPRFAQKAIAKMKKNRIVEEVKRRQRKAQRSSSDNADGQVLIGGFPDEDVKGQSQAEMLKFWMTLASRDFSADERKNAYNTVYQSISTFEDKLAGGGFLLQNVSKDVSALDVVWWVVVSRFLSFLRDEKVDQFHRVAPNITAWHARLLEKPEFGAEIDEVAASEKQLRRLKRCLDCKLFFQGSNGFTESSMFSMILLVFLLFLMYLSATRGYLANNFIAS